jgi:hypothetical protein
MTIKMMNEKEWWIQSARRSQPTRLKLKKANSQLLAENEVTINEDNANRPVKKLACARNQRTDIS